MAEIDELAEEVLEHSGVLGMKWGVRKAVNKSDRIPFGKDKPGALDTPLLKLGGALMDRDIKKFDREKLLESAKEMKKDKSPKSIDSPVSKSDTFLGDGYTSAGVNYSKYSNDNSYYYKYENGEKQFTSNHIPDDIWLGMNAKGDIISEKDLSAYKEQAKHSDIVDWALDALSHADENQSVVIVAIPSEDDPVWKVSSEKVPHMTLLYLGENGIQNEENVVQFVQHIAENSMRRFGMSVDRRGTLGEHEADVLFFQKDWMTKNLIECRAHLLTNDDISTAYNAAEQYPDFTPHLTLGYPESPAKKPDNDYGLNWVNFDRIAIWFGDSEGPEFVLPRAEDMMVEPVYHSELHEKRQKRIESQSELASMRAKARANREANGEELMHHGVQGMRWGYRRGVGPDGRVTGVAKKVGRVAASAGKKSAKFSSEQAAKRQQKDPKDSADHELLKAALTRDVSKFTTQEIKAVNARIKALGELENVRAENAAASRSKPRKLASWALENVAAGAKSASESYIQNLTGSLLKGALPDIGDLTGNSGKKKTEKPQEKAKDKVFDADKKSDKKASSAQPPAKSGPLIDGGDGKRTKKSGSSKERDDAIDDLVYTITNVKKKKGR